MKTQLQKPAAGKARYSAEYKREALEHWRNSGRSAARVTGQQYRKLMTTYHQGGVLSHAAMKAGIHRESAARYLEAQAGPTRLKAPHTWGTRPDPLSALWLEAKP